MIVQSPMVKGGIAAVVNGYRGSRLEEEFDITYVKKLISQILILIHVYFNMIHI